MHKLHSVLNALNKSQKLSGYFSVEKLTQEVVIIGPFCHQLLLLLLVAEHQSLLLVGTEWLERRDLFKFLLQSGQLIVDLLRRGCTHGTRPQLSNAPSFVEVVRIGSWTPVSRHCTHCSR